MNKFYRLIAISVILGSLSINLSLGNATDCGIFGVLPYSHTGGTAGFDVVNNNRETNSPERIYSNFLSVEQQKNILTKDDLNTAILNLKKYCCDKKLGDLSADTCSGDSEFFNENALDSQYLFDHIFDVMMRRLTGLTGENDIYTKTNMTVDEAGKYSGKNWREFINSKAEDLSGSDAQSIIDEYLKFWSRSDSQLGYNIIDEINGVRGSADTDFLSYVSGLSNSEESKKVAKAIQNYDNWTLYDRYENVCGLARYFYVLLYQIGGNTEYTNLPDRNTTLSRLSDGTCEKVVRTQIDEENEYVQLVIQRSANLFLKNYIEGYLKYGYERLNKLKKKWRESTDRWLDVVRAVPHLVATCVK